MKTKIILLFLLGIVASGCIENPLKQVPVLKVNISFVEKGDYVVPENLTFTQGMVDYAARPRNTIAQAFPAISGRTLVVRNGTKASMNATGPWEVLPYKGNGTYTFNIGFDEEYYPQVNDSVHISIIVVDEKGRRIGYVVEDMIWG
ncbi:MAG: hypothetical protein FIB07_02950 [Candidatus Methanoperedens sp.]|nr:hypothetical protein [Candidatus Methanoperedens sp.]